MKIYISNKLTKINPEQIVCINLKSLNFTGNFPVDRLLKAVGQFSQKCGIPTTVFETDHIYGNLYLRSSDNLDIIESKENIVEKVGLNKYVFTDNKEVRAIFREKDSYSHKVKTNTKNIGILCFLKEENRQNRQIVKKAMSELGENIQRSTGCLMSEVQAPKSTDNVPNIHSSKRVLSGIRPTNLLHIGNYFGSVLGMLTLQNIGNYQTMYMVADMSAITTPFRKESLGHDTRSIVIDYLACGIDPTRSTLFIQSHVPEHVELAYLLSSMCSLFRLQHINTFKDKIRQYPQNVTLALLTYPVLMASGITLYKNDYVPVGADQEPHIKFAREIAKKMNSLYGTNFPTPKRFATEGEYIPSLLGEGKMSKSVDNSFIGLTDDLETIKKKISKIPTDSGSGKSIPKEGGVATLLSYVEIFQGKDIKDKYMKEYLEHGLRYSDIKCLLSESVFKTISPIQQRRKKLEREGEFVDKVLRDGRVKARRIARETVLEVRQKMGFLTK